MPFKGFQFFNSSFGDALQNMIAARPGISVFSGYRTPKEQAVLFRRAVAKYGSVGAARHNVAPPPGWYGSQGSRHNWGVAADLAFASPEDRAWAHANAAQYGLNFRMGHEPWHIELNGASPQMMASAGGNGTTSSPPPPSSAPPMKGYEQIPDPRDDTTYAPQMAITGVQKPQIGGRDAPIDQFQPANWDVLANLISPSKDSDIKKKLLNRLREYT